MEKGREELVLFPEATDRRHSHEIVGQRRARQAKGILPSKFKAANFSS